MELDESFARVGMRTTSAALVLVLGRWAPHKFRRNSMRIRAAPQCFWMVCDACAGEL